MDKKEFLANLKGTLERQIEEAQAKEWAEARSKDERLKALEEQAKAQSTASSMTPSEWTQALRTSYTLAEMEQEYRKAEAEKWEEGRLYWSERLRLSGKRARKERWGAEKRIPLPSPPPERKTRFPEPFGSQVKPFQGHEPIATEPLQMLKGIRLELGNRMPREVFLAMQEHLPQSEWEKLEAMWETVIKNFDRESQQGFFQELEKQVRGMMENKAKEAEMPF